MRAIQFIKSILNKDQIAPTNKDQISTDIQRWTYLISTPFVISYLGTRHGFESLCFLLENVPHSEYDIEAIIEFAITSRSVDEITKLMNYRKDKQLNISVFQKISTFNRSDIPSLTYSNQDASVADLLTWQAWHGTECSNANYQAMTSKASGEELLNSLDGAIYFGNESYFINMFNRSCSLLEEKLCFHHDTIYRYLCAAFSYGEMGIFSYLMLNPSIPFSAQIPHRIWNYKNLKMENVRQFDLAHDEIDIPFHPRSQEHVEAINTLLGNKQTKLSQRTCLALEEIED